MSTGDFVDGKISSIELEGSEAPLLLSIQAQKRLRLIITTKDNTVYSDFFGAYLDLVDRDGLPGNRLMPRDFQQVGVALQSEAGAWSTEDEGQESEKVQDDGNSGEVTLRHLNIADEKSKTISKGKKKQLGRCVEEVEREDVAMWSSVRSGYQSRRRTRQLLRKGCKTFLMEIFAGAATLSCLAAQYGMPISAPIDIIHDGRHDLMIKENRDFIDMCIEEDDPYLLTFAPVCGPWSQFQNINMAKSEATAAMIAEQRRQWYPVIKWVLQTLRGRLKKGRDVLQGFGKGRDLQLPHG